MTLADLVVAIRGSARSRVILAWRTAYYHRIKDMPDLREELDALGSDAAESDVGPGGYLSEARMNRVWGKIKAGLAASNARLAGEAGA